MVSCTELIPELHRTVHKEEYITHFYANKKRFNITITKTTTTTKKEECISYEFRCLDTFQENYGGAFPTQNDEINDACRDLEYSFSKEKLVSRIKDILPNLKIP